MNSYMRKPSGAFVAASWAALFLGVVAYVVGLWNAVMALNEKGYYFVVLMFGLFSAVSIQKSVRDRADGIPVTGIYLGVAWFSVLLAIVLLAVGLWNASSLQLSEKGFYAMAFALSLFAAIVALVVGRRERINWLRFYAPYTKVNENPINPEFTG